MSLLICQVCGEEFNHSNNHNRLYCSKRCKRKAQQKLETKQKAEARIKSCEWCRVTFTPERSDAKFCSLKCKQIAYRERKSTQATKPYILKVGILHRKLLRVIDKCDFSGGDFHISDHVEAIQTCNEETQLIVRTSGKLLESWKKPFADPYIYERDQWFKTPDQQNLCSDAILYRCYLLIGEHERLLNL